MFYYLIEEFLGDSAKSLFEIYSKIIHQCLYVPCNSLNHKFAVFPRVCALSINIGSKDFSLAAIPEDAIFYRTLVIWVSGS